MRKTKARNTAVSVEEEESIAAKSSSQQHQSPKKLSRKERKEQKRALAEKRAEMVAFKKTEKKNSKQAGHNREKLSSDALGREKVLWEQYEGGKKKRARAKDIYGFIGFNYMYEDGTCEVEEGLFSQTLAYSDISYQAAKEDDQDVMFNNYAQIFDYCGPETSLQTNVINTSLSFNELGDREFFSTDDINLKQYVDEYNRILNDKMLEGCSNITKRRYLTYSVAARSYEEARKPLARMFGDLAGAFNELGCTVERLDGHARLELIASQLKPGQPFDFEYKDLVTSGLTAKDFVCPSFMDFSPDGDSSVFRVDKTWFKVMSFRQFGAQIRDDSLSRIIDLQIPLNVSMHVQAIGDIEEKEYVNKRLAYMDMEIIKQQQKAARKGYDSTLLPQELSRSKNDAEELREWMQEKNQHLFMFSATVMTYADTYEDLIEQSKQIIAIARSKSIYIDELECQQKQALNSALPLGANHIEHYRNLTTSQVAIMLPFATQEINDPGGGYYGQNKVSNNLILFDRKGLAAAMGWVFGMPGSGKSFAVKREITNRFLTNNDAEFFIVDPKNEYPILVEALGGTTVPLSPDSKSHINVFDIFEDAQRVTGDDPALFKTETILALAAEIMGTGDASLNAQQKSIIDRCVRLTYREFEDSETPPTLGDFYRVLKKQSDEEALDLITAFELYTEGGLNYFNHITTVNLNKRITSFSFNKLGGNMRVFAMLVILDFIYNRMLYNFERGVETWVYIDEVQALFDTQSVMEFFTTFWAQGRSYNLVPTAITQTVGRVITHPSARQMLDTSDFLLLLKQSDNDRKMLSEILGLSDDQSTYISRSIRPGEGLLVAAGSKVPFKDDFPHGNLYDLWNTKPDEIAEQKRANWMKKKRAERTEGKDAIEG